MPSPQKKHPNQETKSQLKLSVFDGPVDQGDAPPVQMVYNELKAMNDQILEYRFLTRMSGLDQLEENEIWDFLQHFKEDRTVLTDLKSELDSWLTRFKKDQKKLYEQSLAMHSVNRKLLAEAIDELTTALEIATTTAPGVKRAGSTVGE